MSTAALCCVPSMEFERESGAAVSVTVAYSDGTQVTVNASDVQRSRFLMDYSSSEFADVLVLPEAQQQPFASWLKFLKLRDKHGATTSSLIACLQVLHTIPPAPGSCLCLCHAVYLL